METIQDPEEVDHTREGSSLLERSYKAGADCDGVVRKERLVIVPKEKIDSTIPLLRGLLEHPKVLVRNLALVTGRIQSLARAFAPAQRHSIVGASIRRCVVVDRKSEKLEWPPSLETLQSRETFSKCDCLARIYSSFAGSLIFQEAIEEVYDNVDNRQQGGFKGYRYLSDSLDPKRAEPSKHLFQNFRSRGLGFKKRNSGTVRGSECGALIIIVVLVWVAALWWPMIMGAQRKEMDLPPPKKIIQPGLSGCLEPCNNEKWGLKAIQIDWSKNT
ncbi:46195_t:CDS:2 [Gigaspora margarita]|uniref:46195_t:CDS:1 n=1 Tax=Gigaspora margarita TaxID=4874 RepID=A0ABN7W2P4_GIGMA|nr:46195_t:CDS:2 [Gigaspora margarita]